MVACAQSPRFVLERTCSTIGFTIRGDVMKKILFLLFCALVLSVSASAHTAFRLVSIEKKTLSEADVNKLQKERIIGKVDKSTITYNAAEVRLVVLTGPEEDMLSYWIQGIRNPNLVVPAGATLRILLVNVDSDMRHDI